MTGCCWLLGRGTSWLSTIVSWPLDSEYSWSSDREGEYDGLSVGFFFCFFFFLLLLLLVVVVVFVVVVVVVVVNVVVGCG